MNWELIRGRVAGGLDALGLLRPASRIRTRYLAMRAGSGPAIGRDGLPLPPPRLRLLVDGRSADGERFVAVGSEMARVLRQGLASAGVDLEDLAAILDFGCGCGRVARHFASLRGPEIHGCDYNEEMVRWCDDHLPFMHATRNELEPPTEYDPGMFDLVYAGSVLTHLSEDLQGAWLREFGRLLKPNGLLAFTTLGAVHTGRLTGVERQRFEQGEIVIQRPRRSGENACTAYHPRAYVEGRMLDGFETVRFVDGGAPTAAYFGQDMYIARYTGAGRAQVTSAG